MDTHYLDKQTWCRGGKRCEKDADLHRGGDGQDHDRRSYLTLNGYTVEVRVHFDSSYPFQSWGHVKVLNARPISWETLATTNPYTITGLDSTEKTLLALAEKLLGKPVR